MLLCVSDSEIPNLRHRIMQTERHLMHMAGSLPRRFLSHRIGRVLLMVLFALVGLASAAASQIELVDGTKINGELVSVSNGRYVIRSPALGEIELPASSIRSIMPSGEKPSAGAQGVDFQNIQQQIVSSPELMQLVTAMMSDPEIQSTLKDPEFMQLIMSGDLDTLKNDPRILRLMNNPSMQAILGKMQHR